MDHQHHMQQPEHYVTPPICFEQHASFRVLYVALVNSLTMVCLLVFDRCSVRVVAFLVLGGDFLLHQSPLYHVSWDFYVYVVLSIACLKLVGQALLSEDGLLEMPDLLSVLAVPWLLISMLITLAHLGEGLEESVNVYVHLLVLGITLSFVSPGLLVRARAHAKRVAAVRMVRRLVDPGCLFSLGMLALYGRQYQLELSYQWHRIVGMTLVAIGLVQVRNMNFSDRPEVDAGTKQLFQMLHAFFWSFLGMTMFHMAIMMHVFKDAGLHHLFYECPTEKGEAPRIPKGDEEAWSYFAIDIILGLFYVIPLMLCRRARGSYAFVTDNEASVVALGTSVEAETLGVVSAVDSDLEIY